MKNVKSIRKLLETHRMRSKKTEYPSDMPTLVQKCTGCAWIGWHHDQHVAEIIAEAVQPLITTVEQLKAIESTGNELAGALIKSLGLVNPENGRYDLGEVYEQNADGTWALLGVAGHNGWEDRAVTAEEMVLPALLLWEPSS